MGSLSWPPSASMLWLVVLLASFCESRAQAQQRAAMASPAINVVSTGDSKWYYGSTNEPPRAVELAPNTVSIESFLATINERFGIPAEFTFVEAETNADALGMRHRFMQQYYKGILLEGLGYRVHERGGFVTSANGRAVRDINLEWQSVLSEDQAFQLARSLLKTTDTTRQSGRMLIVSKAFTFTPESFRLAYQFDIDVSLIERWRISIDARTGQQVNKVSLVNTCFHEKGAPPLPYSTGTGTTNYYGTRTIRVEQVGEGSRLVGQTEHGGMIGTYDYGNASILAWFFGFSVPTYDFYSSDKTFNEAYQRTAVSVQWGAEQAFEYYYTHHNRNSYDNAGATITSYVRVDQNLDNAFWSRNTLLFGDGSNNNPLVQVDVVAHELTHGVTQNEAALEYYNESGALNESFSDILGKAVEFYALGDNATWLIAKEYRDGGLRDMSDPNRKEQPDTYMGDLWYTGYEDYGGVHYNSGVQNYWYYLLCNGGSGTNDHQVDYSVQSIGMEAASQIVYRNLTEYLGPMSQYIDSRIGSLLAAADLYGKNSAIYQEVDKAWDAVGVIDEPIITSLEEYDITATTVKIRGTLEPRGNTVSYYFEYGTTPAYGSTSAVYTYDTAIEGMLTELQSETRYYYRIVATNENGASYQSSQFTTISLAPLLRLKHTVDLDETSAILYGEINPNSLPTSFHFEYGTTPALGQATPLQHLTDTTEFLAVTSAAENLLPRQLYYYRLVATNGHTTRATSQAVFFTATKPVVDSFTPRSGPVDIEVTIAGRNFNPVPDKNLVHFGAVQATVVSGNTNEIRVKVPAGASFGPLSLTDAESNLTTQSVHEFVPTFSGNFDKSSFQLRVGINDIRVYDAEIHDMDGDGRPDIVTSHSEGFTVFQNVNQGGDITAESFVRVSNNTENVLSNISLIDFDGNGLKDIVGDYSYGLRIYPNFSVPGYIFFGVPVDLPETATLYPIVYGDFDADGHIDIAGYDYPEDTTMLVFIRNQNPKGVLTAENFVKRHTRIIPDYAMQLASDDLNNDGKPEILISKYLEGSVPVLLNNSHPYSYDFQLLNIADPLSQIRYPDFSIQDLNQDGRKDVAMYSSYNYNVIALFENASSPSDLNMDEPLVLDSGVPVNAITPADIDGDGKVDLLIGSTLREFLVLKNQLNSGETISDSSFLSIGQFGNRVGSNGSGGVGTNMSVNDLNGDGRPEVVNAHWYSYYPYEGYNLEIWQNADVDCLDPALIQLNLTDLIVNIIFPANSTLEQYEIEYSTTYSDVWYPVHESTLYVSRGNTYTVRARAKCYLGYSTYNYWSFTTECVNMSSFSVSAGATEAYLSAVDFNSFEVSYSLVGKNAWIEVPQYWSIISGLTPGTTYDIRYRGRCSVVAEYQYQQFTTLCPDISQLYVSELSYNRAVITWSGQYTGNVTIEYSEDNSTWYTTDETHTAYPLIPGKEYFVRARYVCMDVEGNFIHLSFTTPCPTVALRPVESVTPFSAAFSWLDESSTGSYHVTYAREGTNDVTAIETESTGIALDGLSPGTRYSFSVAAYCLSPMQYSSLTFNTLCYAPFNLSADDVTPTSALLTWDENYSGMPYTIDYSVKGSNRWQHTQTSTTTVEIDSLRPGTRYEARVHIECLNMTAPYESIQFVTDLYDQTTFAPNPTDATITIRPSRDLIGSRFMLVDGVGKVVATGVLSDYTFDFSGLSPGVYHLKIDNESPMKILKR